MRIVFGVMAALGVVAGLGDHGTGATIRNVGAAVMAVSAAVALAQSGFRRSAGVRGHREVTARRAARVAAMTGAEAPKAEDR